MLCFLSRAGQGDNAKASAPPHVIFTCNEPITSWQLPQCPVLGTLGPTDRYIIQLLCQLTGKTTWRQCVWPGSRSWEIVDCFFRSVCPATSLCLSDICILYLQFLEQCLDNISCRRDQEMQL